MYEPKNTLVDDVLPPPLPKDFLEVTYYHYRDFPKPYWKRYLVAKRFVDCQQAKTPKLIKSGMTTKFFVVENSPDYRMDFYDGSSVHEGTELFITDKYGRKYILSAAREMVENLSEVLEEF